MSDDIRREDVLEVLSHQRAGYHDESLPGAIVNLIESRIRALPPSPRAAAAQRLARAAKDYHERSAITGHTPGHLAAEDELQEALAAWREAEGRNHE